MPNNLHPQSQHYIFTNQTKAPKTKDAHGDVRQDTRSKTSARIASAQPARSHIPMRAQPLTTKTPRSQNTPTAKRRTVQLTLWTSPIVKAKIAQIASREGLSVSAVGAAFLERGLQTEIDMEYGALLTPVFEHILTRYMAARDNRLALLLVRVALAVEQTRSLTTNILGRQPRINRGVLNDILDKSLTDAKKKITRHSPELEDLITEVKRWVTDQEQKGKTP
jgi:hypothetical protein